MSSGLVRLLRELVAIDSTSTGTNLPMVAALERHLVARGFSCEVQRYRDDAGVEKANLLGTRGEGLPELALVGHSDCVPFDPSWTEALTLTEREGRLIGRGACDTKAFIACALQAAERTQGRLTASREPGLGVRPLMDVLGAPLQAWA